MMSNNSESLTSEVQNLQGTLTLEEDKSFEKSLTPSTPTATTVIDRWTDLSTFTCQSLSPHQALGVEVAKVDREVEEKYFSFDTFVQQHPYLSRAVKVESEEDVAPTMSPSAIPGRRSTPTLTDRVDYSSLQQLELMETAFIGSSSILSHEIASPQRRSKRRRSGSGSSSQSSSVASVDSSSLQQLELMETAFIGRISISTHEIASPQRRSKRRRSGSGSSSQSSSVASESHRTPAWHVIDTGLGDLDAKSALFLARQQFPTTIDSLDGRAKLDVLRDAARLTKELQRDVSLIGYKKQCVCNVDRHPPWWPVDRIKDIHNYSFLLDCEVDTEGLAFKRDTVIAANNSETIVVHDIPMNRQNPLKLKAEQVLRYIDVEVGFGDQTCDNLFHYKQPETRRILMVVSHCQRVVGIVVAEEILSANRILRETSGYMELEEDPVPVRVGINRLWVHICMRRQHLASLLCQLIGKCFHEKETLHVEDFAFNNINPVMVMFAKVYLKTLRPPLYFHER